MSEVTEELNRWALQLIKRRRELENHPEYSLARSLTQLEDYMISIMIVGIDSRLEFLNSIEGKETPDKFFNRIVMLPEDIKAQREKKKISVQSQLF